MRNSRRKGSLFRWQALHSCYTLALALAGPIVPCSFAFQSYPQRRCHCRHSSTYPSTMQQNGSLQQPAAPTTGGAQQQQQQQHGSSQASSTFSSAPSSRVDLINVEGARILCVADIRGPCFRSLVQLLHRQLKIVSLAGQVLSRRSMRSRLNTRRPPSFIRATLAFSVRVTSQSVYVLCALALSRPYTRRVQEKTYRESGGRQGLRRELEC